MFSSVSAPFCCPMTTTRRPSIRASPATTAASSPKRRSPWSSTNSSAIASMNSSVRGRRRLRASCTLAHTSSFAAASGGATATAPSGATAGTVTGGAAVSGSTSVSVPSPLVSSPTRSASVVRNENGRKAGTSSIGSGSSTVPFAGSSRRRLASSSWSSDRATTRSMKPWLNRNSERWKPGGSSVAMVPAVTRAPAKPMSASGSATFTSPTAANEAKTPPVVGSDRTEM